jgi:hypothetical protein
VVPPLFRKNSTTVSSKPRNVSSRLLLTKKNRSQRPASELTDDKDDLALIEEIEDFALEDMAKLLYYMDPQHPLLVAVSSMKDLSFNQENTDNDGDDE